MARVGTFLVPQWLAINLSPVLSHRSLRVLAETFNEQLWEVEGQVC